MLQFTEDYFQEEEREGFVVSSMMKRVWAAQLVVLEEIGRVCQKLKIPFWADWGTMLGAVRHHGFIPWDDDMDICMMRKDYMRFLQEAPGLLDHWYELKSAVIGASPFERLMTTPIPIHRFGNCEKTIFGKPGVIVHTSSQVRTVPPFCESYS